MSEPLPHTKLPWSKLKDLMAEICATHFSKTAFYSHQELMRQMYFCLLVHSEVLQTTSDENLQARNYDESRVRALLRIVVNGFHQLVMQKNTTSDGHHGRTIRDALILTDKNQAMVTTLSEQVHQLQNKEEQIAELEESKTITQKALGIAQTEIDAQVRKIQSLESVVGDNEAEIEDYQKEINKLQAEIEDCQKHITKLHTEVFEREIEIHDRDERIQSLVASHSGMQFGILGLNNRLTLSHVEMNNLKRNYGQVVGFFLEQSKNSPKRPVSPLLTGNRKFHPLRLLSSQQLKPFQVLSRPVSLKLGLGSSSSSGSETESSFSFLEIN